MQIARLEDILISFSKAVACLTLVKRFVGSLMQAVCMDITIVLYIYMLYRMYGLKHRSVSLKLQFKFHLLKLFHGIL